MRKVRRTVVPGEFIAERRGRKVGQGVYVEGFKVYSKIVGIPHVTANEIYVTPLTGIYIPKVGDRVIGVVTNIEVSGWWVDINCPWPAFLPLSLAVEEFVDVTRVDLSRYYNLEDILYCKVAKVTATKDVQLSMRDLESKRLYEGILIKVSPAKIPRIVGRNRSMINLIKTRTGCKILIGENGVIWVKGKARAKVLEAIKTIEKEALFYGLTTKIERMLGVRGEGREVTGGR
jgi:exosome complex component RRP4